jgi:hypothetical protein
VSASEWSCGKSGCVPHKWGRCQVSARREWMLAPGVCAWHECEYLSRRFDSVKTLCKLLKCLNLAQRHAPAALPLSPQCRAAAAVGLYQDVVEEKNRFKEVRCSE